MVWGGTTLVRVAGIRFAFMVILARWKLYKMEQIQINSLKVPKNKDYSIHSYEFWDYNKVNWSLWEFYF